MKRDLATAHVFFSLCMAEWAGVIVLCSVTLNKNSRISKTPITTINVFLIKFADHLWCRLRTMQTLSFDQLLSYRSTALEWTQSKLTIASKRLIYLQLTRRSVRRCTYIHFSATQNKPFFTHVLIYGPRYSQFLLREIRSYPSLSLGNV